MSEQDQRAVRVLEAAYWRALRKRVRAENVMNGTRDTFLDRLKKSYFANGASGNGTTNGSSAGVASTITALAKSTVKDRGPKARVVEVPKAKARLPLPFFGLELQAFRSSQVLFTCVVGDRHQLQDVDLGMTNEHVLFSDRDLGFERWDQRPLLFWDANPKLITLFHKYALANLVAPGTRMIWRDSRVELTNDVAQTIFSELDNHDLCLFKHYERDCVYDEVLAVLDAKRSGAVQCEEFSKHLRERSFPRNAGLFETGIMGFKVTPAVVAVFRKLFGICYRYAPRDQLALPLALAGSDVRVRVYNDGQTHLRNSPGVLVKSWKEVGAR